MEDKKDQVISFDEEDITNIENLFTNTRFAQVKDKALLRESLDDEVALLSKMLAIEKHRDDLLKEKVRLEKEIKKLKSSGGKTNK